MSVTLSLLCLAFPLLAFSLAYTAYTKVIWSRSFRARGTILKQLGLKVPKDYKFVGFFHPYCNAGGGGERVLWTAIAHIQQEHKNIVCIVYSGDTDASKQEIIDKVKGRFAIDLDPSTLHFFFLKSRGLVEGSRWPRFTILGQSLGSMYLVWEAMSKFIPDLYIDTMGYAFTFPAVAWLTGASVPIGAYVHYPTISTDMLARVRGESWKMRAKRLYYRLSMYYYALSLSHARFLMVNSSWTHGHIASIVSHEHFGPTIRWAHHITPLFFIKLVLSSTAVPSIMYGMGSATTVKTENVKPEIVYPPCDTREMAKFPLEGRERILLSVAQFRPEKNLPAQLHAFTQLLADHPEYKVPENGLNHDAVRLVLLGGARHQDDLDRVESLRVLAKELGIQNQVSFVINAPYPDVLQWLSRSSVGLSTMIDEHFGINVVEFMAAGLIPLTHASGGPLNDIVVPYKSQPTGFHARTPGEYAVAIHEILTMDAVTERGYRERARQWAVQRFSEEEFVKAWKGSGWSKYVQ
ncbi:glycosyltransferase family 4 protein [Paxillus involutus ATCC 200175]|uniref:GDP-Man:Man(3)GlcNAc(2)-PP-Dol alpha-1,2-mannosyltransferase n=1 Tax=Paxillus involutus ATCC 200175 TaxID=664439 RepID=A0A0C9TXN2_PAXIN|nr:glycosyltransferase family 4 protein [Paxillus involutus ATCC 200175]